MFRDEQLALEVNSQPPRSRFQCCKVNLHTDDVVSHDGCRVLSNSFDRTQHEI